MSCCDAGSARHRNADHAASSLVAAQLTGDEHSEADWLEKRWRCQPAHEVIQPGSHPLKCLPFHETKQGDQEYKRQVSCDEGQDRLWRHVLEVLAC